MTNKPLILNVQPGATYRVWIRNHGPTRKHITITDGEDGTPYLPQKDFFQIGGENLPDFTVSGAATSLGHRIEVLIEHNAGHGWEQGFYLVRYKDPGVWEISYEELPESEGKNVPLGRDIYLHFQKL